MRELRERRMRDGTPEERREHRFTAVWTAARLGVNRGKYLDWETKGGSPTGEPTSFQLRRFADLLGLGSEDEERLFVQWMAAQVQIGAEQIARKAYTRGEVERAVLAAVAILAASRRATEPVPPSAYAVPAQVRPDRPDPVVLERFLLDARHHLVNAGSYVDRALAEHHLSVVERDAAGEIDPSYRRLLAWAAHLRGSQALEAGDSGRAGEHFGRSFALAIPLPDAHAAGQRESDRGNLLLSARYGLAAAALAWNDLPAAIEHLEWWETYQGMLKDPGPHIWRSAIHRSAVAALLRLGRVAEATHAFEEAATRYTGAVPFDALTVDAQYLMLDTYAALLHAQGERARAGEVLHDALASLGTMDGHAAAALGGRPRIEIRLIESRLTLGEVPEAEWERLARRALLLDRQVGFPKSVGKVRRLSPGRWDTMARDFPACQAAGSRRDLLVSPPLATLQPAAEAAARFTSFQDLLQSLFVKARGGGPARRQHE
jgi:hypothetical protein